MIVRIDRLTQGPGRVDRGAVWTSLFQNFTIVTTIAIVYIPVVTTAKFQKEHTHMPPVKKKAQTSQSKADFIAFMKEGDEKAVEQFEAELAAAHEQEERRR